MEWQVVTVVIALVGLIGGITTPMLKLNSTITKLMASVDSLKEDVGDLKNNIKEINDKNRNQVERLWKKNDEQDKVISDHDTRITVLEKK